MNKVYNAGYSSIHPGDFVFDVPAKTYKSHLLVFALSPLVVLCGDTHVEYPANTCILYEPNARIYYRANGVEYNDDWLYWFCDEPQVLEFPKLNTPFTVTEPEYCHNLFQLITWEMMSNRPNNEWVLSDLIHMLLNRLYEDSLRQFTSPYTHALYALQKSIQTQPGLDWNVPDMAKQLHISTSYLQLLYKQQFGLSCLDDVIQSRITRAQKQLAYTRKSIAVIASECGYHTQEHFSRQFKKHVGLTPGQFRKQNIIF